MYQWRKAGAKIGGARKWLIEKRGMAVAMAISGGAWRKREENQKSASGEIGEKKQRHRKSLRRKKQALK
jgi:hypothetical protein